MDASTLRSDARRRSKGEKSLDLFVAISLFVDFSVRNPGQLSFLFHCTQSDPIMILIKQQNNNRKMREAQTKQK